MQGLVLIQPFDHELKDFFLFGLIMNFMIQIIQSLNVTSLPASCTSPAKSSLPLK